MTDPEAVEFHIRRRGMDQFDVTLITQFHESTASAPSIGEALLRAADTIQWPVPEGMPKLLDSIRALAMKAQFQIRWTP